MMEGVNRGILAAEWYGVRECKHKDGRNGPKGLQDSGATQPGAEPRERGCPCSASYLPGLLHSALLESLAFSHY